jgi:hypothetical protein
MKGLIELAKLTGAVVVGGWLLGIVLDEAGQGKYGTSAQNLAKKATKGFGI